MSDESALIIYDGECIFCQNYARLVRLKESVGAVDLVDARSGDPRVARYRRLGFDLDEGMLFVWRGKVHHGADAVHVLAGLSSRSTWFNRLNRAIFSSPAATTALYPLLKLGRRATLFLRGKGLIAEQPRD
jgi:predicted DCC family thiol-disulfide oxidoreductase YuxK